MKNTKRGKNAFNSLLEIKKMRLLFSIEKFFQSFYGLMVS